MTTPNSATINADIQQLVSQFHTVLMATCSKDGVPEISYSPYAIVDRKLHVFLSDLAMHTGNLKANPRASLLFLENEADAEKLHARKRVTFSVDVEQVERGTDHFKLVMKAMESRFGDIMPVLESLPDFHLFAMNADAAVLVRGFADAHTVACDGF